MGAELSAPINIYLKEDITMTWTELLAREKELELALQEHLIWNDELQVAWLRHELNKVKTQLFDLQESCIREYGSATKEIIAEMCAP
tara:strand:- start:261 stop:521 length:261 start_codon:yes stop_codon:yes gene_type:complete